MDTTRVIRWQENMNDSIDDEEERSSMYATAQTLYNVAHEVEYNYYCEDNASVLRHVKDMKKWSKSIMKQLK
jgi:chemotaxis regulatin CheY-phosphate phosphatase CheZ